MRTAASTCDDVHVRQYRTFQLVSFQKNGKRVDTACGLRYTWSCWRQEKRRNSSTFVYILKSSRLGCTCIHVFVMESACGCRKVEFFIWQQSSRQRLVTLMERQSYSATTKGEVFWNVGNVVGVRCWRVRWRYVLFWEGDWKMKSEKKQNKHFHNVESRFQNRPWCQPRVALLLRVDFERWCGILWIYISFSLTSHLRTH